jgi:ADP-ribose pyrophosphatase YjhB (NUDIX family)
MNATFMSPFYRVATRAIILTPDKRLVLVEDENHELQVPGGGWEHDETFEDCLRREVREELGVEIADFGPLLFTYRQQDKRGFVSLRLAVRVTPANYEFHAGDDMVAVKLIDKDEFTDIMLCPGEGPIQNFAAQIWGS